MLDQGNMLVYPDRLGRASPWRVWPESAVRPAWSHLLVVGLGNALPLTNQLCGGHWSAGSAAKSWQTMVHVRDAW